MLERWLRCNFLVVLYSMTGYSSQLNHILHPTDIYKDSYKFSKKVRRKFISLFINNACIRLYILFIYYISLLFDNFMRIYYVPKEFNKVNVTSIKKNIYIYIYDYTILAINYNKFLNTVINMFELKSYSFH